MQSMWSSVLTQFAIERADRPEVIGKVCAYDPNFYHGHVYFEIFLKAEATSLGWPLEAAVLFINHVFERYGALYKIYSVMVPDGDNSHASGVLPVEARLKGHLLVGERRVDQLILSVNRDEWAAMTEKNPLLARVGGRA